MGIGAHMTVILQPTLLDLPGVNLNNRLIPWKESSTQNQTNIMIANKLFLRWSYPTHSSYRLTYFRSLTRLGVPEKYNSFEGAYQDRHFDYVRLLREAAIPTTFPMNS